jgi:hypothetical protein
MESTKSSKDDGLRERIAWYKWEFLRRNVEYQREHEQFQSEFGAWFESHGYWWDTETAPYNEHSRFFFCSQIAPIAKRICERWEITNPFPPSWDFAVNGLRKERGSALMIPTFRMIGDSNRWNLTALDPSLYPDSFSHFTEVTKHIPETIDSSDSDTEDYRIITVPFDVTVPLRESIAELMLALESGRERYKGKVGPLPDHRKLPRRRIEEYEGYLAVWELRTKGRTFEEIARERFPREIQQGDRLSPAVKRVRIQYKRANELISGGYKQIDG